MQFNSLFSAIVLITAVLSNTVVARFTNFGDSCTNIVVFQSGSDFDLEADCPGNNGTFGEQVIGLNMCLVNVNGGLGCRVRCVIINA